MKELERCPFCGGKSKITSLFMRDGYYTVECTNEHCKAIIFRGYDSKEKAVEAWNKRFNDDTIS